MAKTKKKNNLLFTIVLLFLLAVMVVSGIMIIRQLLEYSTGDNRYQDVVEGAVTEIPEEPGSTVPVRPQLVNFDQLRKQNEEVVGWLYSKETVINYPVVQAKDNDYYLTHLFDRTENKMGAVFMEYKNQPDVSDKNTILYGHHMKNGSMFASLIDYQEQAYYEQHPELYYATPEGDYHFEVYAGFLAEADETCPLSFGSDEDFLAYAQQMKERSTFDSGITINEGDRLMTLYTCSYEFSDARYLLVGRLIPWESE